MAKSPTRVVAALAASLIAASPVPAAAIDVFSVGGVQRGISSANGQDAAWRDVGFRVESELFDAEIRTPTCIASAPRAAGRSADNVTACSALGDGLSSFSSMSRRAFVTFKAPRPDARLPYVDVTVRTWDSAIHDFGQSSRGTAANVVVTKPVGSFDAIASFETPFQAASDAGRWRTASIGVGWTSSSGLSLEVTGDRARDIDSAAIDRTLTIRLAYRLGIAGARIAAWSRRSFDDPLRPWRAGFSARISF